MVGAGEGTASHCAEGVGVLGVVGPIRCLLHCLHEAADEEVILQRRDALLREDGRLPTHWTGQSQALGGDVVLEASGQGGKEGGAASVSAPFPHTFHGCRYTLLGNLSGWHTHLVLPAGIKSSFLTTEWKLTSLRRADISAFQCAQTQVHLSQVLTNPSHRTMSNCPLLINSLNIY